MRRFLWVKNKYLTNSFNGCIIYIENPVNPESKRSCHMTTNFVVADGVAKRRPTADEWEMLLENKIPELIRRYKAGALDPAAVNSTLQQVLEGAVITEQKMVVMVSPKPKPDKFELLTTFEVTVPADYNHATRLTDFKEMYQPEVETEEKKKQFYYYNPNITDANFSKATTQLVPGRKFQVKIFGIKSGKSVSSDECLNKLRSENAVLVGAQGASLAYEQGKVNLPKGKWHVSFDEKDALWFDGGDHGVPCVFAYSGGDFRFRLGYFEGGWGDNYCLLCFCDLPAGEATLVA